MIYGLSDRRTPVSSAAISCQNISLAHAYLLRNNVSTLEEKSSTDSERIAVSA